MKLKRNVYSALVFSVLIGLPLATLFQNCSGGGGSSTSSSGSSVLSWPTKVSGDLPVGGHVDVQNFEFSPDSSELLFLADKEAVGKLELYAALRDGSSTMKLSHGGEVGSFKLISGTNALVFTEGSDLYRENIDGTQLQKLSGTMVSGGQILDYALSTDNQTVYFLADKDAVGVPELYASSLTQSTEPTPVKLHPAFGAGQSVQDFQAIDGNKVIFRAAFDLPGKFALYSVNSDGSDLTEISQTNSTGGVGVTRFISSQDGNQILYSGDFSTLGTSELYVTSADGSGQAKVNAPLTDGGQILDFALTPLGQNAIYLCNCQDYGKNELFQRDLMTMNTPVKISPNLVSGGNVSRFKAFTQMTVVNNSPVLTSAVALIADADVNDQFELYVTADLNQQATKVNGPITSGGDIFDYVLSADGQSVAYSADEDVDGQFELYARTFAQPQAMKLVSVPKEADVVPPLQFIANSARVLFVADLGERLKRNLYVATVASSEVTGISQSLGETSNVYEYKMSPDGRWAAYTGDQSTPGVDELFVAPIR